MPTLKQIKLEQQEYFQTMQGMGLPFVTLFYGLGHPVSDPNTHINMDNRLLLVYLLGRKAGLDEEQEVPLGFEERVQFFTLPYIKEGATQDDFIRIAGANEPFKKIVDEFLKQESQTPRPMIVAVSEPNAVNNSHFSAFILKKEDGKLIITVKDSILAAHHFESPEFNTLKEIIATLLPAPTYNVAFTKAPTASQDAADCLIHTVHNLLQDTLGARYTLTLNQEAIVQIRKDLDAALTHGIMSLEVQKVAVPTIPVIANGVLPSTEPQTPKSESNPEMQKTNEELVLAQEKISQHLKQLKEEKKGWLSQLNFFHWARKDAKIHYCELLSAELANAATVEQAHETAMTKMSKEEQKLVTQGGSYIGTSRTLALQRQLGIQSAWQLGKSSFFCIKTNSDYHGLKSFDRSTAQTHSK